MASRKEIERRAKFRRLTPDEQDTIERLDESPLDRVWRGKRSGRPDGDRLVGYRQESGSVLMLSSPGAKVLQRCEPPDRRYAVSAKAPALDDYNDAA